MPKKQKSPPSEGRFGKIVCMDKNDLTQLLADPTPNVKRGKR